MDKNSRTQSSYLSIHIIECLPVLSLLVFGLVVVHDVGPQVEYVSHVGQSVFRGLARDLHLVILATFLLFQIEHFVIEVNNEGQEFLSLQG